MQMANRVAFCLVENISGQVLRVQRGYSSKKYKLSLPGSNVDGGEGHRRAATRQVREETGLRVETISSIFEGHNHPIKTYFGKIQGGRLKAQTLECLDARFSDYSRLPPLAFSADHRAINDSEEMKANHVQLVSNQHTLLFPDCGSAQTRLRHYPHHNSCHWLYCNRIFAAAKTEASQ